MEVPDLVEVPVLVEVPGCNRHACRSAWEELRNGTYYNADMKHSHVAMKLSQVTLGSFYQDTKQ